MNDALPFQVMKALDKAPEQSQRALSERCGVSLRSVHYCLNALIEKGFFEGARFQNRAKQAGLCLYNNASGHKSQKDLNVAFLRRKQAEYEALEEDLAQ